MKISKKKQLNELHVHVEYPLYNPVKSSGASYYPRLVKFGTPKVLRNLAQLGVEHGELVKNAILDNRSEVTLPAAFA